MKTVIEIRSAAAFDRPNLYDLLHRSWMTTWAPECPVEVVTEFHTTDPVRQYLDACLDQIEVGIAAGRLVAAMHLNGDNLAALHVDPDVKSCGFGSAMMDEAEARGAACLEVRAFNRPAIGFYVNRGWRRIRTYLAMEVGTPMLTHEYCR